MEAALAVLDTGRERGSRPRNVNCFTSGVYFGSIGDIIRVNHGLGRRWIMGPVHFNRTKVKQEDRYGKRRK